MSHSSDQRQTTIVTTTRNLTQHLAKTGSEWIEKYEWVCVAAIVALYALSTYIYSSRKLLWHDELFTLWIAQAPTWHEMIHLTRTLDWNPPLLYVLDRWSLHFFGAGAQQLRLPSMLAYAGCALCIYFCVRRWTTSAVWGLLGLLAFFAQDTIFLADEARPYALVMCFIACSYYLYEVATENETAGRPPYAALAGLAISGALCMLSHIFALFPWGCLLLIEGLHAIRTKQVSWLKWLALLLPLAVTPVYRPMLQDHGASVFPIAFQPTWQTLVDFYTSKSSLLSLLFPVLIIAVCLLGSEVVGYRKLPRFRLESALLITVLFVAPAALMFYLRHSHAAFWPRYGFCFSIAFALAVPVSIYAATRGARSVGIVLLAGLVLTSIFPPTIGAVLIHRRPIRSAVPGPCLACQTAQRIDPSLPLVDASGLDYVEMNAREPDATVSNLYYVYDLALGVEIANATIFEGMPHEQQSFRFHSKVARYADFTQQHQQFFVLGDITYPEQWLLRKLLADGAEVELIGYFPQDGYFSKELYRVRMRRH